MRSAGFGGRPDDRAGGSVRAGQRRS
jgi:hypothetical protein